MPSVAKGCKEMDAFELPDDGELLVGYRRMAEFASEDGVPTSHSTMQKVCSPAINTGPELIGYYGQRPASTKGAIRRWNKSRLSPNRPPSNRWPQEIDR